MAKPTSSVISSVMGAVWIATAALFLLAWRVWSLLPYRRRAKWSRLKARSAYENCSPAKSPPSGGTVSTMIVLGSGGHTSEMLKLTSSLSKDAYSPLCYVVASTDHTSAERIPLADLRSGRCRVCTIPRSREVGQSYLTSVYTTLVAGVYAASIVVKTRPDLVLVNGPGTCIPVCAAAFALRVMGIRPNSRTIFCESFCRVKSLSLSGRIMYLLADRFIVQWPELLRKYPRAEYVGQLM